MEYLFDDEWVDRKAGVRRVVGQPRKEPEPVLKPEAPWERGGVLGCQALLRDRDKGTFRLWYRAKSGLGVEEGKTRLFLCYAESRDGVEWERPSLDRFEYQGRRENNIILELSEGDSMFWNVLEHGSDRGMTMQPSRCVEGEEPTTGIGLARVTGRNFCGLRAGLDGLVETKWLCNYGDAGVRCAAEMDRDGWVRAEILDQYGQVIPGWGRAAFQAREAPGGELRLSWGRDELMGKYGQSSDEGGEVGHVIKVRFYLHKATLFGFQVGDEEAKPEYACAPPGWDGLRDLP